MAEDMFDKARETFFGAGNITPKANTSPDGCLEPRSASSLEEVAVPSPDKREADQPLAFLSAAV